MSLPRSTFYDKPATPADEAEIVARMRAICDEFESYGYRRVGAALRHQGIVVNSKRVRRLMRVHDLQPRRRRRFVTTTDSAHDRPIFPDRAKGMVVDAPNQLWVADITYIAIEAGFVYLAAILDAWSRRVVGYAISRSVMPTDVACSLVGAWRALAPTQNRRIAYVMLRRLESTVWWLVVHGKTTNVVFPWECRGRTRGQSESRGMNATVIAAAILALPTSVALASAGGAAPLRGTEVGHLAGARARRRPAPGQHGALGGHLPRAARTSSSSASSSSRAGSAT